MNVGSRHELENRASNAVAELMAQEAAAVPHQVGGFREGIEAGIERALFVLRLSPTPSRLGRARATRASHALATGEFQ
jgi:hypothetical protein